ncbi:MAG TPA: hypothetical protein PKN32_13120 [Bacteroidales bacterium]|nr:hypothetical protein [Bacteroidales bacterium]
MKKYFLLFVSISFILFGCKTEKQKEGIEKADSMLEKIEILKKELSSPEIVAYKSIYDTTKLYVAFFESLPPNFERTDSIMDLIYNYGTVDKCFKKLHSVHLAQLSDALDLSKSQITNLRHDIDEGFFTDDEIDVYIHTEDSILKDIEELIKSKLEFAKIHAEKYKIYHPMIVNLKKEFEEKYY